MKMVCIGVPKLFSLGLILALTAQADQEGYRRRHQQPEVGVPNAWAEVEGGVWLKSGEIEAMALLGNHLFVGTREGVMRKSLAPDSKWVMPGKKSIWPFPKTVNESWIRSLFVIGDTLYAGAADNRAYRSTDLGDSWTRTFTGLPKNHAIVSFALVNTELFVSTLDYFNTNRNEIKYGIYRSTDQGKTWVAVLSSHASEKTCLAAMGGELFIGFSGGGIGRSSDGGASLIRIDSGLHPHEKRVKSLVAGRENLFASTWDGLYRSNKNGTVWSKVLEDAPKIGSGGAGLSLAINDAYVFSGGYSASVYQRPLAPIVRKEGQEISQSDKNKTLLTAVVRWSAFDVMNALKSGAEVNSEPELLWIVIRGLKKQSGAYFQIFDSLVAAKIDVNRKYERDTPLSFAYKLDDRVHREMMVKRLIEAGADTAARQVRAYHDSVQKELEGWRAETRAQEFRQKQREESEQNERAASLATNGPRLKEISDESLRIRKQLDELTERISSARGDMPAVHNDPKVYAGQTCNPITGVCTNLYQGGTESVGSYNARHSGVNIGAMEREREALESRLEVLTQEGRRLSN